MKQLATNAFAVGVLLALTGICTTVSANNFELGSKYEVTITNLTPGVSFTPFLVVSHSAASNLFFAPGGAPTDALAALAEGGDRSLLSAELASDPRVLAISDDSEVLLEPGKSVTLIIRAIPGLGYISLAAMLLPTNDGTIVLQNQRVPVGFGSSTAAAYGYDAGSETNDELCESIPGPHCGGEGISPGDDGEGFVHIHPGIQGVGDLAREAYDWKNPVAWVEIKRAY